MRKGLFRPFYALLLMLVGAALAVPGVELLYLGGSAYYLVAGIVIVAAGLATWRGSAWGHRFYLAMLLGTTLFALWEVGLDGWALVPRLVFLVALGVGFLILHHRRIGGRILAGIALLALIGVGSAFYPWPVSGGPVADADAGTSFVPQPGDGDWAHYGRDLAGTRYSPLAQITPGNVGRLKVAWTYRIGPDPVDDSGSFPTLEATPIKVGDSLYVCTAYNDIIALDAETGHQKWRFRAHSDTAGVVAKVCRGVAYHDNGQAGECGRRILTATIDARLIAVDAATGRRCSGFGQDGVVDLTEGMGDIWKGYYYVTSAPTVVDGRVIVGGMVADGQKTQEPSGVVRAFDAITGKLAWAWDLGRPGQNGLPAPGNSYTPGTPNSWAPMSGDEKLGLVYVPTGNATPDYVSAHRNKAWAPYSSAVAALDVKSGKLAWIFQTVHNDVWDYDAGSQPTLMDLPIKGQTIPVLIQPTKRGQIFVLDRRNGKPVFPVQERPVPTDGVPGETLSPTQPYSTGMPDMRGPRLTERMMWGVTPFDQLWCRIAFRKARYEGDFTPLTQRPTIVYPGYLGGMDWGSISVDPVRRLLVTNANHVSMYNHLLPRAEADRMGLKPKPAGKFGNTGGPVAQAGTPYAASIKPFLSPIGAPCQQPPYGTIAGVDLTSGAKRWDRRLGIAANSGIMGIPSRIQLTMGVPTLGGSFMTASGLTFIASSQDATIRAFDSQSGAEMWRTPLPAGGQATPMTYWSAKSGRQFVVIAAGGNIALRTATGDYIIGFALDREGGR